MPKIRNTNRPNLALDRLRKMTGARTDAELAERLKVPKTTISTWRARGTIPYKKIVEFGAEKGVSIQNILGEEGRESQNLYFTNMDPYIMTLSVEACRSHWKEKWQDMSSFEQAGFLIMEYRIYAHTFDVARDKRGGSKQHLFESALKSIKEGTNKLGDYRRSWRRNDKAEKDASETGANEAGDE